MILVTSDASAAAFFDELLEGCAPREGHAVRLRPGLTCIAAVGGAQRRRLLVIDGEPVEVSAASLVEAVHLVDEGLPIVLVRYGAPPHRAFPDDRVVVVGGPLISPTMKRLVAGLLARDA